MTAPTVEEPTDPQDGTEEPEGSSHPAAAEPVPEQDREVGHGRPPADGRTGRGEPDAAQDNEPADHGPEHRDTQPARPVSEESDQGGEIELLRASWPEIVSALAEIRRVAWTVTMRGTPVSFDGQTLRIAFDAEGDLLNFPRFENDVRAAIHSVLGIDCRIEAVRPGDSHGGGQSGGKPGGPTRGRSPSGNGSGGPARGGQHGTGSDGPGGPTRGTDQGTSGQQSTDEPPVYFHEQEGFGAQRRRPAPDVQPSRGEQDFSQAGHDAQEQQRPSSRTRQSGEEAPEPDPEPAPDEPVTSWSVAKIPQGGPAESSAPIQVIPEDTAEAAADSNDSASSAGSPEPAPLSPADFSVDPGAQAAAAHADNSTPDIAPEVGSGGSDQDTAMGSEPVEDLGQGQDRPSGPVETSPVAPPDPAPRQLPSDSAHSTGPSNEYWTPNEPPPPPEDEPPADLYEMSGHRPTGPSGQAPTQVTSPRSQRPSFRERHAAEIAAARQPPTAPQADDTSDSTEDESFSPSADDESIEDSSLYGRAAIERILGGLLIEERPHQAN